MSSDVYVIIVQALDTFNAAIVSPVYYVMFTTLTIIASAIMFKVKCLIRLMDLFLQLKFDTLELPRIRAQIVFSSYFLQDWSGQNVSSITSELCGFITVLSGTIILHATREQEPPPPIGTYEPHSFTLGSKKGLVLCWWC